MVVYDVDADIHPYWVDRIPIIGEIGRLVIGNARHLKI